MKCYYEILGIARDADDGEIKIAYRKLALKWHPDKNIENPEFAKEQFQLVQQAYEVLSDRQERAWYDNHREQILRGSDSTYTDDSLDVFPYFSSQCFSGYGDDEKGFYTVYRKVFEKIANEDMQHMEFKEDFIEIPGFGNSESDYKEVVAPFYAYWSNYSTKKSYVWLDPYNINDTVNRRHARLVEKENKKIRQKAKRERNEEIQNLVAFVRKRDKRVEAHAKIIEAAKAERKKKQEELRKQKILERKKELHEDNTQAEWSKFDNVKDELKLIEKNLAEEFGESVSDSDESEEEYCDNPDELFCAACNKLFKSKKARINHDSSKKHRENLSNLIRHLQETEQLYEKTADESDKEKSLHTDDENNESHKKTTTDDSEEEEEEQEISTKKSKKVKNKKIIRVDNHPIDIHFDSDEEIELEPDEVLGSSKKHKKQKSKQNGLESEASEEAPKLVVIDSSDYEFSTTKKNKKKKQKSKQAAVPNGVEKEEKTIQNQELNTNKKNKQNKKDVKKDLPNIEGIDTSHTCVKCQSVFTSKNKLFDHLKKTGHSIALPQKDTKAKKKIK